MIDGLKFYKLITLEEVYQNWLDYLKVVPLDTRFITYVKAIEFKGWRIV